MKYTVTGPVWANRIAVHAGGDYVMPLDGDRSGHIVFDALCINAAWTKPGRLIPLILRGHFRSPCARGLENQLGVGKTIARYGRIENVVMCLVGTGKHRGQCSAHRDSP
ncbi:hypothetical protein BaRGS_00013803 [Batillaria attramentaria]|uniref:Uncharacterized protein n=1 Tax=Batillaria attramentaria TaxID=370345 RepID=A0ABD0L5Q4_9CAEN